MLRALVHLLVLTIGMAAETQTPGDLRINSIQVKGNKRYTAEEVTRLSGLAIGRAAKPEDLAAAANRMAGTGLFQNVKYTYTTGRDMSIVFEIVEPDWSVPVIFDNFVTFSDEQLIDALRAEVPSFDGTAPATGGAPEFIRQGLEAVLKRHNAAGRVEFTTQLDMIRSRTNYLFAIKDPAPKVCALRIAGATAISERELVTPLDGVLGGDYSRFLLTASAKGTLTDMYRRKGFWRAEFGLPRTTLDGKCGGVTVTLPVSEGSAYAWDRAEWAGHRAFTAEALTKALGMKPGDLADAAKIDAGLREVRKLYGSRGFVTQTATLEPRLDDTTRRGAFAIQVEEGPQFRMGSLTFEGIREADANMLRSKWKLKTGEIYDEVYEDRYLRDEIFPLKTSAGGRGSLATRVDRAAQVVDVKIVFK